MHRKTTLVLFAAALTVTFVFFASTPLFAVSVKTIYSFCSSGNCADGYGPVGGLILDSAGNLYGATLGGGTGLFDWKLRNSFRVDTE